MWKLPGQTSLTLGRLRREAEAVASSPPSRTSLDGHGIFTIIVFALVSLIVLFPLRIPMPHSIARLVWKPAPSALAEHSPSVIPNTPTPSTTSQAALLSAPPPPTAQSPKAERHYITLNHVNAPIIGVIVLLATHSIDGKQVKDGIVGAAGVEPYDVLLFFISLAYIAISLDATGLLRFLAFTVCIKAGSQGRVLYLLLYLFFWTAGVLVGNDPVILSGTAFLVYLTRVAGIVPPSAWIWAQFVAANVSSAVLVSSNPTNLVIASAFGISFPTYTAYMVLPSFGSALAALFTLLVFFRDRTIIKSEPSNPLTTSKEPKTGEGAIAKLASAIPSTIRPVFLQRRLSSKVSLSNPPPGSQPQPDQVSVEQRQQKEEEEEDFVPHTQTISYIPSHIVRPEVDPRAALVDKTGAIFVSFVMAATLGILIATSVTGHVKVYQIALPGAGVCLIRDASVDWLAWRKARLEEGKRKTGANDEAPNTVAEGSQGQTAVDAQGNGHLSTEGSGTPAEASNGDIELTTIQKPDAHVLSVNGKPSETSEPTAPAGETVSRADPIESNASSAPNQPGTDTSTEGVHQQKRPEGDRLRPVSLWSKLSNFNSRFSEIFPTVSIVLSRLPFPLLPFAFGMFILVQGLDHVGFIWILADGVGKVCAHGPAATAFFISLLGIILCNVAGTNIGATIILTEAIQSPSFTQHLPVQSAAIITKTALYSVALGSNIGALGGTFAASLAGLLWREGLRQGGIKVTTGQFALWCAVVIIPATAAGVGILLAEVTHFTVGDS
ncbi:hypothetical protein OC861_004747 [Tilletia horrida]|nr:hypothetical protein OC861_004747 [Tilletia horrida]